MKGGYISASVRQTVTFRYLMGAMLSQTNLTNTPDFTF